MSKNNYQIQSFVRIRPVDNNEVKTVSKPNMCTILTNRGQQYQYDNVFDQNITNQQIYNATTLPNIQRSFHGYNCCILAYGQTFSGKTYTMKGDDHNPGIVPLSLNTIFQIINQKGWDSKIVISYIEVYNQTIIDLLHSQPNHQIQIMEGSKGTTFSGLAEIQVRSLEEAIGAFEEGQRKRKFASNNLNVNSSRSHVIFRIRLSTYDPIQDQLNTSLISLVDLAGSEGIGKTNGEKIGKIQGQNINKSLLSLTKVIKKLSEREKKQQFIGFRESKLTRILKQCMFQNSLNTILCMINPIQSNYQQTINTLKFGQTAAKINIQVRQNNIRNEQKMRQNMLRNEQMLPSLKKQIQELRAKQKEHLKNISELNKKAMNLQQQNYNKQIYMNNLQIKITSLEKQLQQNRQQMSKQIQKLAIQNIKLKQCNVGLLQQNQKLQFQSEELRRQKKKVQRNQKALCQSNQHYENQIRNLNGQITQLNAKLQQQNSRMSKTSSINQNNRRSMNKNNNNRTIDNNRTMENNRPVQKPNPFHLKPYVHDPNRQSSHSNLSWIVKLKIQVIQLTRRVNQYTKANVEIQQENQQLRRRLQDYEQQQDSKRRKSSKINPDLLQYKEIKKLQNKLKKAKEQLKKSQQRQKKLRQTLKKNGGQNVCQVEQFEEWYAKKYVDNYFINKSIQTGMNEIFSNQNQNYEANDFQQSQKRQLMRQPQCQKMQVQNQIVPSQLFSPNHSAKSSKSLSSNNRFSFSNNPLIRNEANPQQRTKRESQSNIFSNYEKRIPNQNLDLNRNKIQYSYQSQGQFQDESCEDLLLDALSPAYGNDSSRNFINMNESRGSKKNSKGSIPEKAPMGKRWQDIPLQTNGSMRKSENEQQKDLQI